jgi:hypothetical protein
MLLSLAIRRAEHRAIGLRLPIGQVDSEAEPEQSNAEGLVHRGRELLWPQLCFHNN